MILNVAFKGKKLGSKFIWNSNTLLILRTLERDGRYIDYALLSHWLLDVNAIVFRIFRQLKCKKMRVHFQNKIIEHMYCEKIF